MFFRSNENCAKIEDDSISIERTKDTYMLVAKYINQGHSCHLTLEHNAIEFLFLRSVPHLAAKLKFILSNILYFSVIPDCEMKLIACNHD